MGDQTINPSGIHSQESAGVSTFKARTFLWPEWAHIAIEQVRIAASVRTSLASTTSSEALVQELRSSMIAISASSHALDALYGAVISDGSIMTKPPSSSKKNGTRPPRHAQIAETLKLAFHLGKLGHKWVSDFEWLFAL